jgi:propanediol utilization protein
MITEPDAAIAKSGEVISLKIIVTPHGSLVETRNTVIEKMGIHAAKAHTHMPPGNRH